MLIIDEGLTMMIVGFIILDSVFGCCCRIEKNGVTGVISNASTYGKCQKGFAVDGKTNKQCLMTLFKSQVSISSWYFDFWYHHLLIIADLLKAVSDISNSSILCLFYDGSLEPFSMADSTNCFSENFCFCCCSKTLPRDNKLGFVIGNSQYFWHNTALRFVNKKCLFLLRYYKNVTTPTNNSVEWVKLMIFRHDTKYIDTVNDQFLSSSKIERWQYWQVLIIVIKQATT